MMFGQYNVCLLYLTVKLFLAFLVAIGPVDERHLSVISYLVQKSFPVLVMLKLESHATVTKLNNKEDTIINVYESRYGDDTFLSIQHTSESQHFTHNIILFSVQRILNANESFR